MKKAFLILPVLLCTIAYAQINPKIITNPNAVKVFSNTDVANLKGIFGTFDDFYIVTDKLWGKEVGGSLVTSVDCVESPGIMRWKAIQNTDGSYNICNKADITKKLIERINLSGFNNNIRYTGQRPNISRDLFVDSSTITSQAITGQVGILNKWFLRLIDTDKYWLIKPGRTDSSIIRILPASTVPNNAIDWSFATLNGWDISEGSASNHAFSGQPSGVNIIPFYTTPVIPNMPLGGSYWQGLEDKFFSFRATASPQYINTARPGINRWALPDETKLGVLISKPFLLCSERVNYRIGGTNDPARIKVELLQKIPVTEAGAVTLADGFYRIITPSVSTGHNHDVTRGVAVNMATAKYTVCRFRITDNSTTGHILVSGINFENRPTIVTEAIPANPLAAFPQKPIWGAIDMHTHPTAHMGMGGKLMHGGIDGDPAVELRNCNEIHGGWGVDNPRGNFIRAEVVNLLDEHDGVNQFRVRPGFDASNFNIIGDIKVPHNDHHHDGYPALLRWPAQSSMIHQQMWFEWLQRANQGGLKAIIALTINSEVLAKVLGADGVNDDKSSADRQIAEITAFAGRHSTMFGIATNPTEMRSVINSGRMAIIIGMEVDHIGNFYANANVTETMIRDEIASLKRRGVSYIFPIHVTDNKFGGAAAYKEIFNYGNKFATGQPISGSIPPHLLPPVLPGNFMKVEHAPDSRIGFNYSSVMNLSERMVSRTVLEMIEFGGIPPVPPPPPVPIPGVTETALVAVAILNGAIATANVPLIPTMIALKSSTQYQLLKKYFLDVSPELDKYATIAPGHRNALGLTDLGKFAVKELMRQGMMIDMDHSGEKSVNDIIRIAVQNDYPVNAGHNSLRSSSNDNEKTRTRQQLDTIRMVGGMFGIGWEDQTPAGFNTIYTNHLTAMGNKNTTFGSDIDGYAATPLKPADSRKFVNYTDGVPTGDQLTKSRMGGASTRVWNYNTEGMAHIGLVPDFFEALKKDGMSMEKLNQLFLSAEYFAQMWEKCLRRAPLVER
jgi:microsomal dipeptidase-like Zn-dependent dipeptidase